MPTYKVTLTKTAQKQLEKLPNSVSEDLLKTILSLSTNPRPQGFKKLKGRDGYRLRSGSYRIIYDIIDKILVVEVIALGHRKDIYE